MIGVVFVLVLDHLLNLKEFNLSFLVIKVIQNGENFPRNGPPGEILMKLMIIACRIVYLVELGEQLDGAIILRLLVEAFQILIHIIVAEEVLHIGLIGVRYNLCWFVSAHYPIFHSLRACSDSSATRSTC